MTPLPDLSPREQEVVNLLLEGKSNKQIASALHITERTVEFHLKNIYLKAQVSSRVELILKLGESTVADREQSAENRDQANETHWTTSFKEGFSKLGKELKMENVLNATPDTGNPMTFVEAIRTCLAKYADFEGRASRAEFWWFALFVTLGTSAFTYIHENVGAIFTIAMLLPLLAVGTRRLRETGRSGWWELLLLVPVGGIIILGFWWAEPPLPASEPLSS